jgi:DHA2 family multidrug resistance protein
MQLATNGLMLTIAVIFFISAFAIALAPKPSRAVDAASIGH